MSGEIQTKQEGIERPNKGIHADPKSRVAFGPGDARRYVL